MKRIGVFIVYLLFLPLVLMGDIVKSNHSGGAKVGFSLLVMIVFGLYWLGFYQGLIGTGQQLLYEFGVIDSLIDIPVSGTSMLPTIKDGAVITLHSPKKFGLDRGDAVSFTNDETGGLHYLKRIVGLPGERISIQNGSVLINNQALKEPYILNNLPTYGNSFLLDCEEKTIPEGHYFVMGDNRTVSSDSRVVGFVAQDDIDGVQKSSVKPTFATRAETLASLPNTIDPSVLLSRINNKRVGEDKLPVITNSVLSQIAFDRAGQIAANPSLWKNSLSPLSDILSARAYRYNLIHEFVTFGYLTEGDVITQILESEKDRTSLMSREITEMGVGIVTMQSGVCSVPVIVVIGSWPSVPTYDQKVIDQWMENVESLDKLIGNMQTWVGQPDADQKVVQSIISKGADAHVIASRIHTKMINSQWIDAADYKDIETYKKLVDEVNELLSKEFGDVQGVSTIYQGRVL